MRKLITILLILVSLNSYTQVLDSIPNTTETERIIDKYSDNIISGFNTVIEKVTPLAEDGFTVVTKLQLAKGIGMLIPLILCIIFFIWMISLHKKYNAWSSDESFLSEVLFIVTLILALLFTYNGLLHIIAPEWFAIKEIMDLF